MRQRAFGLIAWVLPLALGCAPRLAPMPLPVGMVNASLEAAVRWTDSTRLRQPLDIRFRFRSQNEDGSAGGRGRARFAPHDSIRFDLVGPLGMGRASVFVVGDSAIWTEPEEKIRRLVPNWPLFWAMLGIARPPSPGPESSVRSFSDQQVTAWQFAAGTDTVEYVLERGATPRLLAEVRQGGTRIGRVETRYGSDGLPSSSRLTVPRPAARLELTFQQHTKVDAFAPETWIRPAPAQR